MQVPISKYRCGKNLFYQTVYRSLVLLKNAVNLQRRFLRKTLPNRRILRKTAHFRHRRTIKVPLVDTLLLQRHRRNPLHVRHEQVRILESSKDSFVNLSGWVDFYEREAEKHEEIRVLVGAKKDKLSANNTQV